MKLFLAFIVVLLFWPTPFETSSTAHRKNLKALKVTPSALNKKIWRLLVIYDHLLMYDLDICKNEMEEVIHEIMGDVQNIFKGLDQGLRLKVLDTVYYYNRDGDFSR